MGHGPHPLHTIFVIPLLQQTDNGFSESAAQIAIWKRYQQLGALLALRQADRRLLKASADNQWPEAKLVLDEEADPADVNSRDWEGRSPLHWFAEHGNAEAICQLVRTYEAHTSAVCKGNKTPLHYILTAKSHQKEVCDVLAEAMSESSREGIDQVELVHLASLHK